MKRPTNLRAKIRIIGSGEVMEARPLGFGMLGSDGKTYNRKEYQILKRWAVDSRTGNKATA